MRGPVTIGPRAAIVALIAIAVLMSCTGLLDAGHELDPINITAEDMK